MKNTVSAEEAVSCIRSHDRVFIHSAAAAPKQLVNAMTNRAAQLHNVEVIHLHTEGDAPYSAPELQNSFRINSLFVGANVRHALHAGYADYTPVFLSEVPLLFRRNILSLDVALISVSPPDKHGFCSLGVSVDVAKSAVECAKIIVAQINSFMPRTHGDGLLHIDNIHYCVRHDEPLPVAQPRAISELEKSIGEYTAAIVENGAALQMGIGSIPDAVLLALKHHKNLGIHTEMFSDGVIPLVESGAVTGSAKVKYRGKIVSGFVFGSQQLYDFIDDNPMVQMLDISYVNDTSIIRKNPKTTAINSAIEIDVTGQVCADSIGSKIYSGVGGQMDFIRGASLSEGGKPIIALPSTTSRGESRIVPQLKPGAGVVTTRSHVHYVVTEYGVASLYGKTLRQRAKELIEIAHPNHRESLYSKTRELFGWSYLGN